MMLRTCCYHLYYLPLLLLISITGAGCTGQSPQAVFYTLSAIDGDTAGSSTTPANDISIGIGPVTFPAELDRPAIVTRTGQNQLNVNEFHRWGSSLGKNFTRVMVENMAVLMKTDQVMARPWESYFQPKIRIAFDIQEFGGRLGEYASLNTTWTLIGEKGNEAAVVHRTSIKETVADDSYDALVAAQSRAVAALSREIAEALTQILPPVQ